MSSSFLLRYQPRWPLNPTLLYYILMAGQSACFTLAFTLNLVYQAKEVGLTPLQIVLVGTVLEAAYFSFEVPTGIVADLYSRRLSTLIGLAMLALSIILMGSIPSFVAILVSQIVAALGYALISGAIEAWATDEIGEEAMAPIFMRGNQIATLAGIAGTIACAGLGLIALQLPIILGGVLLLALTVFLSFTMAETHFHRTDEEERTTWGHMLATAREGFALARSRPVVRTLVLVSFVGGLASEAWDRLWVVHLIEDFRFPELFGTHDEVVWVAGIGLVGSAIGFVVAELAQRVFPNAIAHAHPTRLLAGLSLVRVGAVLIYALTGMFWLGLAALWLKTAAEALLYPVSAGWMNRHLEPRVRATVLSIEGQANAIGQVIGGPGLGVIGNRSLKAALVGAAMIWSLHGPLYARLKAPKVTD